MIEFQVTLKEDRNLVSPKVIEVTQYEHKFTHIKFECPRYIENKDMSTMNFYVAYERRDRFKGESPIFIEDMQIEEDKIYITWDITKSVTSVSGAVAVNVNIKEIDSNGIELLYWSSFIYNSLINVKKSIKGEEVEEEYPDVISALIEGLKKKITRPLIGKIGQILSVKKLDEEGSPIEFEAIDMGEIGGVSQSDLENAVAEAKGYVDEVTPTKTSELENDSGFTTEDFVVETNQNSMSAIMNEIQPTINEAKEIAEHAEVIARGRATGYVFDTYQDMIVWLQTDDNITQLVLGDNLYIRELGVPDYWWDGKKEQQLETEKPDLSNCVMKDDKPTALKVGPVKVSKNNGININDSGVLQIVMATESDIDDLSSIYKVIVPSNLVYAVQSAIKTDDVKTELSTQGFVKNTNYATYSEHGVVKGSGSFGVGVNSSGIMIVEKATQTAIDEKTDGYHPIVPSNLDYEVQSAVKSDSVKTELSTQGFIKDTDYASTSKAGISAVNGAYGININSNNRALYLVGATESEIDKKTSAYKPIVPSNLDYAVGSVIASETQRGTAKMWVSEDENGEIGLNISTEV